MSKRNEIHLPKRRVRRPKMKGIVLIASVMVAVIGLPFAVPTADLDREPQGLTTSVHLLDDSPQLVENVLLFDDITEGIPLWSSPLLVSDDDTWCWLPLTQESVGYIEGRAEGALALGLASLHPSDFVDVGVLGFHGYREPGRAPLLLIRYRDGQGQWSIGSDGDAPAHSDFLDDPFLSVLTEILPDLGSESPGRRGPSSRHYRNPDGSHTAVIAAGPIHYMDEDGRWQPIDNHLYRSGGDEGGFGNGAGDLLARYPHRFGEGPARGSMSPFSRSPSSPRAFGSLRCSSSMVRWTRPHTGPSPSPRGSRPSAMVRSA